MAEEIEIPLSLSPHPSVNANGLPVNLNMTNNVHRPQAWQLPVAAAVDYCGWTVRRIPAWINGTPAGKVYLRWATGSSDTSNNIKFFVKVIDKQPDTDSLDHLNWTGGDELTVLDASNGAWVLNECSVSLSATSQVSGRDLSVLIRRDAPGDGADQLNAIAYLLTARYVADKT